MTTTYVFYGEDRRHIEKGATAYHGFRLDLTKSVDLGAIKAKATAMAAAPQSDLRIRIVPPALFTYTPAADADVLDALLRTGDSGLDDPAKLAKQAEALWAEAMPIRVWVTGKRVDLLAHHAVFDGVRGVELLNELMGNADKAGTVARRKLPSCIVACGPATLVRVLTCDRQKGTLGACRDGNHHESHYLHLPTAAVKRAKATHNLGFAAALQARAAQLAAARRNFQRNSARNSLTPRVSLRRRQGLILHSLLDALGKSGSASTLHVACTVGFKTDRWASLGSGFNHYGAFPYLASLMGSPHDLGKHVAKNMVKNGMASGWACLLANSKKCTGRIFERGSGAQLSSISPTPHRLLCASLLRRCTGGIFGDTFKKIYDSIDVLIGGGPLILDKSTGCA